MLHFRGIPGGSDNKQSACNAGGFDPWMGKISWRRKWQPIPVSLPGEFHAGEPGGLQFMGSQGVGQN